MFDRQTAVGVAVAAILVGAVSMGVPAVASGDVLGGARLEVPVQGPGDPNCWGADGWNVACGPQPTWGPGMMGPEHWDDGGWGPGMMGPGYPHHGPD